MFFTHVKIESIYFTFLSSLKGLCHIGLSLTQEDPVLDAFEKRPETTVIPEENAEVHRPVIGEISKYLAGRLQAFSVPADIQGTPFQKDVWEAIKAIPYGQTRSYQQIARAIGREQAPRAVGQAARANPLPLIIPCHRVIGSSGKLVGFSSGLNLKTKLLTLENTHKEKY